MGYMLQYLLKPNQKVMQNNLKFTRTSINSTPLDYIFIKNKHFKINLHIHLT